MTKRPRPELVVADKRGRISILPHLEGAGMEGDRFFRLSRHELVKLPRASELFLLPGRSPVGFDGVRKSFVVLDDLNAVAAFISPGYTATFLAAYRQRKKAAMLPLFSYGAVVSFRGDLYTAAVCVDRELRQDLRFMDIGSVSKGVHRLRRLFPKNRLMRHLECCALTYGCPAAKNFFLSRYEAPLPTSPRCNARCIGCISFQPDSKCPVTQPRIAFVPSPEEVAETALFHIENVADPVVSFGQGCEGEPLMADKVIEASIRLIRKETGRGVINLNTNASSPEKVSRLFDAGLDSIRVSLNSAREEYYRRYYRPIGYGFKDVIGSIRAAKKKGGFVSLNYLVMPGFTDSLEEFKALRRLIGKAGIDMIQWRNLNFDPLRYFDKMRAKTDPLRLIGVKEVIASVKKQFPSIMHGYFNPSRARMRRRSR